MAISTMAASFKIERGRKELAPYVLVVEETKVTNSGKKTTTEVIHHCVELRSKSGLIRYGNGGGTVCCYKTLNVSPACFLNVVFGNR